MSITAGGLMALFDQVPMKKIKSLALVVLAATAWFASSTAATPAPLSSIAVSQEDTSLGTLRYRGHFGGIPVADVLLSIDSLGGSYVGRMDIAASGLLGLAFEFNSEVVTSGSVAENGRMQPKAFHRIFTSDGESGRVDIKFDPTSGLAQGIEDGNPVDGVSPTQLRGVIDPLAALVKMRQQVLKGRTGSSYIEVFDGKRRLNVDARIGKQTTTILGHGKEAAVIPVKADLKPVSGFSEVQERGWEASTLRVLFSADGRAVPVQIMVHTPVGVAAMNLICGTETSCPY